MFLGSTKSYYFLPSTYPKAVSRLLSYSGCVFLKSVLWKEQYGRLYLKAASDTMTFLHQSYFVLEVYKILLCWLSGMIVLHECNVDVHALGSYRHMHLSAYVYNVCIQCELYEASFDTKDLHVIFSSASTVLTNLCKSFETAHCFPKQLLAASGAS